MNYCNLFLGLAVYLISVARYRSFFNPLGVFTLLWLVIIFLYNLRLSYILDDLSITTCLVLYAGIIFYVAGCVLFSRKRSTVVKETDCETRVSSSRVYFCYFVLLSIGLLEIFLKLPPMLAENKMAAYMDPSGIGLRFLHYSIVLLPITYIYIFLKKDICPFTKLILFIPPTLLFILWMQRGMLLWFMVMIIMVYENARPLNRQVVSISVGVLVLVFATHYLGTLRSSQPGDYNRSYISDVSGMKIQIPPALVWLYIYPTSSLNNLNQVLNNERIRINNGYGLLEPVFSLLQIRPAGKWLFNISDEESMDFDVIQGFNVVTYYYWCYKNFGYLGFILIPFLLGCISQSLFNRFDAKSANGMVLYAMWFPNIIQSFHGFLFWSGSIILILILVYLLNVKMGRSGHGV